MTSPNDGQDLPRLDKCKHPAIPSRDLDAAVERYRKTAQAVNVRELVAFLAEFRDRFEPCSEDDRLEGYSTEGEFAAEAYRELFQDDFPNPASSDGDLSFAEVAKTIYNRGSHSFVDDLPDPITPPVSKELIAREVQLVKNGKDTCKVCTLDNANEQHYTSLNNCTPKSTAPPSSPSAPVESDGPAGGWCVVQASLTCTSTCSQLEKCSIIGGPSSDDIAKLCKQTTDDCADGVLDRQPSSLYSITGLLGTNNFATGSANGNKGCPNKDECQQSFKYLASQMGYPQAPGYPDAYCRAAFIDINGYYYHEKIGSIIVVKATLDRGV